MVENKDNKCEVSLKYTVSLLIFNIILRIILSFGVYFIAKIFWSNNVSIVIALMYLLYAELSSHKWTILIKDINRLLK